MEAVNIQLVAPPAHTPADAKEPIGNDDGERMRRIAGDRFVEHAYVWPIFEAVECMLGHPSTREVTGLLLGGNLGSGRTMAADAIVRRHPYKPASGFGYPQVPVIRFSLTGAQDPKTLYSRVLDAFGDKYELASGRNPERRALRRISETKTRLLIVDNAHDLFLLSDDKARDMLKALQYLVEEGTRHAIYISSPEGAAKLAAHEFVECNFSYCELPPWKMDDAYKGFLELLEKSLPLRKPAGLSTLGIQQHLLKLSSGNTKKLMSLIRNAALLAVHDTSETITKDTLSQAQKALPAAVTRKFMVGNWGG